jgi:hypothetical protein
VADLEATSHGDAGAAPESPRELRAELRALAAQVVSLQADVRRLESAPLPHDASGGWDDEPRPTAAPASFGWISALEAPRRARVRIPRLPLELAFLAGAAALAGLAHLRPLVIAGVMGGAWLIVVLAEWAGSRGDRLRHRLLFEAPAFAPQPEADVVRADPTWFTPPVEHTLLSRPSSPDAQTMIAKLPSLHDAETTAERRPGD